MIKKARPTAPRSPNQLATLQTSWRLWRACRRRCGSARRTTSVRL